MDAGRDDMVFRPSAKLSRGTGAASGRIRQQRELDRITRHKRGRIARLARLRAARKARAGRRVARMAERRATSSLVSRGAKRLLLSPPGWIIAGLLVAAAVVLRLATGRSYENMGAKLNDIIFGDLDDQARANMAGRQAVTSNNLLMELHGKDAATSKHVQELIRYHAKRAKQSQDAMRVLMEDKDLQVNGFLDLLVIKIADEVKTFFVAGPGKADVDALKKAYAEASGTSGATRSSR